MLRSAVTLHAPRVLAISLEAGAQQLFGSRAYSATTVAKRGWVPPEQRNSTGRRQLSDIRARRPLVNGKTVAFHVNELSSLPSNSINKSGFHAEVRPRAALQGLEHLDLPPQKPRYESDMVVVLDMDECLIHSKFMTSPQDAQVYAHQLKKQGNEEDNGVVDSFRISLRDGTLVHVHVRPGLYEFLEEVCSRFETHIFTAAMDVYANPVLDHLENKLNANRGENEPKVHFAGRWFRQHCTVDRQRGAYVKNLHNLWPHIQKQQKRPVNDTSLLNRAVLVDNNPMSFIANPENGILVSSFYTDASDNALPRVLNVLEELKDKEDVRPTLEEKFDLKNGLEAIERAEVELAEAA